MISLRLRFSSLILATLLCFGCAGPEAKTPAPAGNLVLRNPAGQVVLAAEFEFPPEPLTPGKNFSGRWRPLDVAPEVPHAWHLDDAGWARYHAEIAAEGMSVDLSLGYADNNLFLLGPELNGRFAGEWSHSGFAGHRAMGTFTLRTGK